MPRYTKAKLAHKKDLEKRHPSQATRYDWSPRTHILTAKPEEPGLGNTPFQDANLERGYGFEL